MATVGECLDLCPTLGTSSRATTKSYIRPERTYILFCLQKPCMIKKKLASQCVNQFINRCTNVCNVLEFSCSFVFYNKYGYSTVQK